MKNKGIFLMFCLLSILIVSCSEETLDDNATGTITGIVVREGDNIPVENVRISTNPTTSTVFTSPNGTFRLENVPVGDYSVQAQKDSLVAQFEGTTVAANTEVNVIFEMRDESVLNEDPIAPNLLSPQNEETELDPTVNFVWNSSETDDDPITYTLKVSNGMNNETLTFENLSDTTYTVNQLNYDTNYFWQVGASDGVAPIVWSETYSFETKSFPEARILFTRIINGNSVIFALSEDGDEFPLTSFDKNSFRPRKNNVTNKIAFLRMVDGQTQLFTMNPDGSEIFQVTNSLPVRGFDISVVDFSWMDDGNSLVYPRFGNLYKVNATTGGGTELVYETPDDRFITEVDVSEDGSKMAIIVNNSIGYNAAIQIIDFSGNIIETVLENEPGAVGGLDFSVDGLRLLYTRDVSGYENFNYRRLDSRMFIYNFNDDTHTDISAEKEPGTNDLDPRFSPNEAEVIFVNTSNDGISQRDIYITDLQNVLEDRELLEENAQMPDWE